MGDPRFLEAYNIRRKEVNDKEEKSATDKRQKLKKRIHNAKVLREKYGHESTHLFEKLNLTECGIYLQYKKLSSKDPGMPKELPERKARCLEWMGRLSPTASPHASDDEEDGYIQDNAAVAAAGLMGLASNDAMVLDELMGEEEVNDEDDEGDGQSDMA